MNTLKDHVLLYDKDCPLCKAYSGAFVKTKMLDADGRQDFGSTNFNQFPNLNISRSRDEIALINTSTGNIIYGIDSLFKIIVNSFPFLKFIFDCSIFQTIMRKVYSFISYNRKVIAPAKEFEASGSCTPSFNLKYRWGYIIVSWIFTSLILNQYALRLIPILPQTNFIREWLICGGQIVFQLVTVSLMRKDRLIHYLGNMMTVSNIGALLLLPALLINAHQPNFHLTWFFCVVSFMLYEHYRRCEILELPIGASISWMAYRLLVLWIIL